MDNWVAGVAGAGAALDQVVRFWVRASVVTINTQPQVSGVVH